MKSKKCETCGERAPIEEKLGHVIVQRHQAACGNLCVVGCLQGSDEPVGEVHGLNDKCPACGPVVTHWRRGKGAA